MLGLQGVFFPLSDIIPSGCISAGKSPGVSGWLGKLFPDLMAGSGFVSNYFNFSKSSGVLAPVDDTLN